MRIALGVTYRGTAYNGWQSQPGGVTVQDRLENALSRFAGQGVRTICAGRTDAGVHGMNQVVHFDTALEREPFSWVRGPNTYLPADVAVQWCHRVSDGFHARNSALGRRYAYILRESAVRPALETGLAGWVFRPLDGAAMRAAASLLIGEHDFSAFRSSECQAKSPVKTLREITIERHGAYWRFEFEASAFLHHMVRNLMGCLVAVGAGSQPPQWVGEVLAGRDRRRAAPTFSPDGLYFLGPRYDPAYGLPQSNLAADWLP
ncbi:tRNA pseudouridine(38-40) synthase TruA [Schlegelella sp. S2-27]|uniref:tRNA pseudouridine synthase A n=1 Tax=Caldimonas mangrovi TaxID=2944811 RepID=A0ABT0YHP0_9BURK|nr:tRNA pseudouridine(38-40) synthase TruA [Caldimonas mangrovi]MCM5678208.1 tRNA pseudouridine(38-40) synthase TruA [Caldimonas mangrovi]